VTVQSVRTRALGEMGKGNGVLLDLAGSIETMVPLRKMMVVGGALWTVLGDLFRQRSRSSIDQHADERLFDHVVCHVRAGELAIESLVDAEKAHHIASHLLGMQVCHGADQVWSHDATALHGAALGPAMYHVLSSDILASVQHQAGAVWVLGSPSNTVTVVDWGEID